MFKTLKQKTRRRGWRCGSAVWNFHRRRRFSPKYPCPVARNHLQLTLAPGWSNDPSGLWWLLHPCAHTYTKRHTHMKFFINFKETILGVWVWQTAQWCCMVRRAASSSSSVMWSVYQSVSKGPGQSQLLSLLRTPPSCLESWLLSPAKSQHSAFTPHQLTVTEQTHAVVQACNASTWEAVASRVTG